MENLKIPYGLSEAGELISAKSAPVGMTYKCPCCEIRLIHRAGEVRARHFAHPPSLNCNLESVLHITAKQLIYSIIEKNARGELAISLDNHCLNCGVIFSTNLPSKTFSSVGIEVRVGNYVCDVVGYRGDSIALAIEILNTHKVDTIKAENLQTFWIELKAEDVLNNPEKWVPTQAKLKDSCCHNCKNHIKHILDVADKFGIARSIYSPVKNPTKATYIADTETCFKCKQEIPVFWWQGVPFCEVEPPNPKPKTIKFRNSKQYGGSYWANTCANCNMIQGDNYLYIFDSAPFKAMPLSTDSQVRQAEVRVISSKSAMSEFMKVITRNI